MDGGIYEFGAEAHIKALVQKNVDGGSVTKHLCEETLGHIRRSTYRKREEFDADPNLLTLENGMLDVESLEVKSVDESYLSLVKLPVKFETNADCPRIKQFLGEVMFPEDIPVVQEFVGYCLWKGYPAQVALLLVGEGSNGKSTFIGIVKALLGGKNIVSRSLQELEFNRFAKADLFGKLANLYADLPDQAMKSVGTFKMLTGGDPVQAEYKFRNSFNFTNYAKLIFSTNKIPEVFEDTTAFFRRWIILTFHRCFYGTNENRNLLKELTTPEELSGFLNWAIEGLRRLKANGWRFSSSKSTAEVRLEYIRKSSPIHAFLIDCTTQDSTGYILKKTLFEKFAEYCRDHKLPAVTEQTFFRNLPLYVKLETARKDIDGKRPTCFIGIRWKTEEDKKEEEADGQQTL